jgi:hypothetical protein
MNVSAEQGAVRINVVAVVKAALFSVALLADAGTAFAQPTASNIRIDFISHSEARIRYDLSASACYERARYGLNTNYEIGPGGGIQDFHAGSAWCGQFDVGGSISGLAPATLYHVCAQASADGTNWSPCVDATFTTAALPAIHPAPPVVPTWVPLSGDPAPTSGFFWSVGGWGSSFIIIDRSYIHGLGFPDRLFRPFTEFAGGYMAIINSDLERFDYWRPAIVPANAQGAGGLLASSQGQVLTLGGGTYYMGVTTCTRRLAVYDVRGPDNSWMHLINSPMEGAQITNNILWFNGDYPSTGIDGEGWYGPTLPSCGFFAKQMMDCVFTQGVGNPNYTFAYNLIVPYYSNSQAPDGSVNPAAVSSICSAFPNVTVLAGTEPSIRLTEVGFANLSRSNFSLSSQSPFVGVGSDGKDLGVDFSQLEAAQGSVTQVTVAEITQTSSNILFAAPDHEGCAVDFSASADFAKFTRVAGTGECGDQRVALRGLRSGTRYYYRILCAVAQPTGFFDTLPETRP